MSPSPSGSPGRLLERPVNRGDRVDAGQLLAALEPTTS